MLADDMDKSFPVFNAEQDGFWITKAVDALRAATKKVRENIHEYLGADGKNDYQQNNSQKQLVGTMSLHDISTTPCRLTSLTMHLLSNEADTAIR